MAFHRSEFDGKPIRPPDLPTRKYVAASEEEKNFAILLHTEGGLHGEYRAIARRLFRRFGNDRSNTSVRNWIKEYEEAQN